MLLFSRHVLGTFIVLTCVFFSNTLQSASLDYAKHVIAAKQYAHAVTILRPFLADNAEAQYLMAKMHQEGGGGIAKNTKLAINWYAKAAEHNYPPAAFALGQLFERSPDVPRNYIQARRWYEIGARLKHPKSQFAFALMLLEGRGGVADVVEGLAWLDLAIKAGQQQAQPYFEQQQQRLTAKQLKQFQVRREALATELTVVSNSYNTTSLAKESK